LTDAELIARALLDDDRDAFGELVLRYQTPLRGWLRRLTGGDFGWADDLAQETFVTAYRQLKSYRHESRFSTWLFAIAHHRFCSEARRRKAFVSLEDSNMDDLTLTSDFRPDADRSEELERAMSCLTREQLAAITLCYQQGMTHEEAAAVLGCPLGTVKTHILRGKQRLLRYFSSVATAPH
jgi:RNA polymerase sigma-70 factor (ECF subfamily)